MMQALHTKHDDTTTTTNDSKGSKNPSTYISDNGSEGRENATSEVTVEDSFGAKNNDDSITNEADSSSGEIANANDTNCQGGSDNASWEVTDALSVADTTNDASITKHDDTKTTTNWREGSINPSTYTSDDGSEGRENATSEVTVEDRFEAKNNENSIRTRQIQAVENLPTLTILIVEKAAILRLGRSLMSSPSRIRRKMQALQNTTIQTQLLTVLKGANTHQQTQLPMVMKGGKRHVQRSR